MSRITARCPVSHDGTFPPGFLKTRQSQALTLVCLVMLASSGCQDVAVPAAGDSVTVQAPSTIIRRVVVIHFNGDVLRGDPRCQASKTNPRTARMWFVDESTIRAVRDDRYFDQPSRRWQYEVTGVRSGTIEIWWADGGYNGFHLIFTDKTSGTLRIEQRHDSPDGCGYRNVLITGEFEIEAPPTTTGNGSPGQKPTQDLHGAVAVQSPIGPQCQQRAKGIAWDFASLADAQNKAVRECESANCEVLFSWKNSCAALAEGTNCGLGWSSNYDTLREAERRAIAECSKNNQGCRIPPGFSQCTSNVSARSFSIKNAKKGGLSGL